MFRSGVGGFRPDKVSLCQVAVVSGQAALRLGQAEPFSGQVEVVMAQVELVWRWGWVEGRQLSSWVLALIDFAMNLPWR